MSIVQLFQQIEACMTEDVQHCLSLVSSPAFISRLFFDELRAFSQMFERVLQKKGAHNNTKTLVSNALRPEIVLAFYSIIILRSSTIRIRHQNVSAIATKADQFNDSAFNTKLAVEILMKIFAGLNADDLRRKVIVGLLLKIRGFKNYHAIISHIHPDYISEQTFKQHFEGMKSACPNLLDDQLNKYRSKWYQYLQDKPLSLNKFGELVSQLHGSEDQEKPFDAGLYLEKVEDETAYLLNRLRLIKESSEIQIVNIEELVASIDTIYADLIVRINETAILSSKKNDKTQSLLPEYSIKQFRHRVYVKLFVNLLSIVNELIHAVGMSWLRKMKWLFNFVLNIFVNFNIKNSQFHESIAIEYSKVLNTMVSLLTSYLTTFKSGLFPAGKLQELVFDEQYSIYKLVESLLYNEYPFDAEEVIKYQNYQNQRKGSSNQKKNEAVVNIVNFSMKSLNINPNWDSILVRIIPNLKNSLSFAKKLLNSCLFFYIKYFEITQNHQGAAKLILMLMNGSRSILVADKQNSQLIQRIKTMIYPERTEIIEGIEYFCEEYFEEYVKANIKRLEEEVKSQKRIKLQDISQSNANVVNQTLPQTSNIKKTQSREAIIEGWQNFESVKDSSIQDLKASSSRPPLLRSGEFINNQVFYSVKENVSKEENQQAVVDNQMQDQVENQILLPQF